VGQNDSINCSVIEERSSYYLGMYTITDNESYIDSAMAYIWINPINCQENYTKLVQYRLRIYSVKEHFEQAQTFINSLNNEFLSVPYSIEILSNRFYAMEAQMHGDVAKRNSHIRLILDDIDSLLNHNDTMLRRLVETRDIEAILHDDLHISIVQYFYYLSILEPENDVLSREVYLQTRFHSINNEFVEYIRTWLGEDFLDYNYL